MAPKSIIKTESVFQPFCCPLLIPFKNSIIEVIIRIILITFNETGFVSGSRPGMKIDAKKAAATMIGTVAENSNLHSN